MKPIFASPLLELTTLRHAFRPIVWWENARWAGGIPSPSVPLIRRLWRPVLGAYTPTRRSKPNTNNGANCGWSGFNQSL